MLVENKKKSGIISRSRAIVTQLSAIDTDPQVTVYAIVYKASSPSWYFSKIVLTRIISIVRIPSLFSNKDNRESHDDVV